MNQFVRDDAGRSVKGTSIAPAYGLKILMEVPHQAQRRQARLTAPGQGGRAHGKEEESFRIFL